MHRRILLLGSTGSIGTTTLRVLEHLRRVGESIEVVGLSAHGSGEALLSQARAWGVGRVCLSDSVAAGEWAERAGACGVELLGGAEGLVELVERSEADLVVAAVVGAAGLPAVLAAAGRGMNIALANKESLVVAGGLLVPLCRSTGSRLIPVDSEHSAIFQALHSGTVGEVARLILTASGGPFRTWDLERLAGVRLADALSHPTWRMGPKITVDSATMFNKALELLEAVWLFGVDEERIEVVVHPQSILHSAVEFVDGSMIAQLGTADMATPVQYAITWPARLAGCSGRADLAALGRLEFERPDGARFPAIGLARRAARMGGVAGAVLNAANEEANAAFRAGRLGFCGISRCVEQALDGLCGVGRGGGGEGGGVGTVSLERLLEADSAARAYVGELVASGGGALR